MEIGDIGWTKRPDQLAGSLVIALIEGAEHLLDKRDREPSLFVHDPIGRYVFDAGRGDLGAAALAQLSADP